MKQKGDKIKQGFYDLFFLLHTNIQLLNGSKVFAGIMIITLNVASKFITIKLSKTIESYLKYTFSRDALIFAIAWVGSRDIYVAIFITLCFIVVMDFLFNEESSFCIFPESFTEYHLSRLDEIPKEVTPDEIRHAKNVLERANIQSQSVNPKTQNENISSISSSFPFPTENKETFMNIKDMNPSISPYPSMGEIKFTNYV
jgi:hypothetical protein